VLYADTESFRFSSTEVEPPPKDSTAHVAERPEISPEILKTLIVAFKNIQGEKDDHIDSDNA
jgi:hypothetical protein